MDLNTNSLLGAGAFAGFIALFWQKAKDFICRIFGLFVITVKIEDNRSSEAIMHYLKTNYKYVKISNSKDYSIRHDYIKPLRYNAIYAAKLFEGFGKTMIWYGANQMFFVNYDCSQVTLIFVRGTLDTDKIIQESLLTYNKITNNMSSEHNHNRFYIERYTGTLGQDNSKGNEGRSGIVKPGYPDTSRATETPLVSSHALSMFSLANIHDILGYSFNDIGQPKKEGAMNMLSLTAEAIKCFEEIKKWSKSGEWFKDRYIPWKRGILLYGKPGTGKTAYVRALGQELNLPIMSFDLSTMTNKDFQEAWERSTSQTPCIVLIEDIDAIFNGRENIVTKGHMNQGLSFDCLLNTIDGVKNSDGVILMVTTNNIEYLDPAIGNPVNGDGMSTRPGRIDRAIEFVTLTKDGKIKMAERIFDGFDKNEWKHILEDEHMEFTGAQFQEKCTQLALKLFWEGKIK
jgi:hypothetical protein